MVIFFKENEMDELERIQKKFEEEFRIGMDISEITIEYAEKMRSIWEDA